MAPRTVVVADEALAEAAAMIAPEFMEFNILAATGDAPVRQLVGDADVLVTQNARVDEETLADARGLQLLVKLGRVYDNVDVEAVRARGVPFGLVPRKGPNCVAEHAMTLVLALSKDLVTAHRAVAEGAYRWRGLKPALTAERTFAFRWMAPVRLHEVQGRTLGCIGFGEIGCELSRRAQAMGMHVLYTRRRQLPAELEQVYGVSYRSLNALMEDSDYACVAVPHTAETQHLIRREQLTLLGPNGYLVNVARGGVVDETALIEALREGTIAGAGLDAFTYEPLPADSPLCSLNNVILTPHIGGGSGTTRLLELGEALEEVRRVTNGEPPQWTVVGGGKSGRIERDSRRGGRMATGRPVRIGEIEAGPGEHAFGYLKTAASRSALSPDIPLHLFVGREPGPTLLVQGAIHGGEIIGTIAILNFVKRLDPGTIRGSVIAVPVVNRMGFELSERGSRIDGKDISRLFPGNAKGSVSDQVAYTYFHEVIRKANVMIDFHAGGQTAYERYVLFPAEKDPAHPTEIERKRRQLVVAFGVESAAFFPPDTFGANKAKEAIENAAVVQFTLEFGGGTGWFKNGEENVRDAERGIWNTMKAMGMIDGKLEADGPLCTVYNACVVLWKPEVDGLFVRKRGFGERLQEGEIYAIVQDPYTGREVGQLVNPREATVIPSGQEWPTMAATSIGILGVVDSIEDRRTTDLHVSFDGAAREGSRA